ncbi:hypothetical protein J1N35_041128, partial [Gossypium stocksii]
RWFFTFLYYTDVASLTAVLAMYLARLKKKYLFSALVNESFVNPYTSVDVSSNLRKRKSIGNAEANKQSFYWTNSTDTSSSSQTSGVKEAHAVSPKFAQIMNFSLISLLLRLLCISQQVMLPSRINNSENCLLTGIPYTVLNIFMMRMFVLAVPLGT